MYRNHYSDIIVTNQNDKTQRSDNPVFSSCICANVIYVCHFNLSRTDRSSKYFFYRGLSSLQLHNRYTLFHLWEIYAKTWDINLSICKYFIHKI